MSEEGYAGRKRWQHDGVSRQETPEAWVKTSGAPDVGRNDADRRSRGGTFVPGEWREEWAGGGKKAKPPEGATCSLCGAWRGWYGLEPTVAAYVEHTIEVLRAIRRVLRKDGCCWWDLDDSRAGGGSGMQGDASYASTLHGATPGGKRWGHEANRPKTNLNPKSLCLIPQRVAIAAQEDGWIVRSQIIIPSWMPESARDRPVDSYRTVLMLTKGKKYWFDMAAVRQVSASDERVLALRRHVEAANLLEGPRILGGDFGLAIPSRQTALLAADPAPGGDRVGVGGEAPILNGPALQDNLSLSPLDAKEGQERGSDGSRPTIAHGPLVQGSPSRIGPLVEIPGASEDLVEQINRLRVSLPDGYQFFIVRVGDSGAAPSPASPTDIGDADMAVGIEDPSEVGENRITNHQKDSTTDGTSVSTRNLGNIWFLPPSAYPAQHFATFPVAEPERCILASCPAEVCVKCGKARVRITENKAMVIARSGRAEAAGCRTLPSGTMLEPPEQTTLGWTDCGCAAGWTPGLILDPFIGTGTTAVAAVKLGRRCIGIDASEEYLKQAVTRLTVGDAGVRRMVKAARAGAKQEVLL